MNSLIVFAVLIAFAAAEAPLGGAIGGQGVHVSQDTFGNYDLKYLIEGISRAEHRDIHGNVGGAYAYIDPHGIHRKIDFTAGAHGFNAIGADIPQPVVDTPEVASAKAHHLSLLHAAYLTAPRVVEVPQVVPLPIAKAAHTAFPVPVDYQQQLFHGLPHGNLDHFNHFLH